MIATHRALIVGGANGIGLSIATTLASREDVDHIYIVDRVEPAPEVMHPKVECHRFDLLSADYSIFDRFTDIDTLMITAGFGRLALFEELDEEYIISQIGVNTIATMRIIRRFYDRIRSNEPFRAGVMVSIAGYLSSPFFSTYGASKAALRIFIESLNVELEKWGTHNRILNVSPGSIKGTSFYDGPTDLSQTEGLARETIERLMAGDDLYIPLYEEVYRDVLERYHTDFRAEGRHSYDYKLESGRMKR